METSSASNPQSIGRPTPATPDTPATPTAPETSTDVEVTTRRTRTKVSANGAVPPAQRSETPDTTVIQQSGDSPVDSTFLPQTVFQVQMGVVSTETREETLICDVLRNRYFRMNVTGAFIWGQIGVEANFQSICMQLQRNYELSATVADGVLMDFMRDVVDAEIVVASTVER